MTNTKPPTHYDHVVRDGVLMFALRGSRDLLRDALMSEEAMRAWHALAACQTAIVLATSEREYEAARVASDRARTALVASVEAHVVTVLRRVIDAGCAVNAQPWLRAARVVASAGILYLALAAVEEAAEVARDAQGDERGSTGCEPWLGGFEARVRERARPLGASSRDGWRCADALLASGAKPRDLLRDPMRFWVARPDPEVQS